MEASLQSTLESLLPKVEALAAQRDELRSRLAESHERISDLERRVEHLSRALEEKSQEAEFLKYSHRLADSPDTLMQTRRHISRLIRRIDASIALLEDDPAL